MIKKFLFLIALAVLLGACAPAPAATPAPATQFPTATQTVMPSPLPEATPPLSAIPTPAIESDDILTEAQKQRLYQESLKYLASSEQEAIDIAQRLQYVQGDGHPSNMCGPLAIAILRDAGLVSKYVDLHDFWLLKPDKNTNAIRTTFPSSKFSKYHFSEPIHQFDFREFPLKAGDFVYLYAGINGSFEHMLTVTRVDEAGRAYSVTNIHTNEGYLIYEAMLYDPRQPGVGLFFEWTDRKNVRLGMTGFGGFDVWRPSVPIPDPDPADVAFGAQLDEILRQHDGKWQILIAEIGGREIYSRRTEDRIHIASVIKVPVAMLFFKSLEASGVQTAEYENYLTAHGRGRTYAQLLEAMLVHSEEEATATLIEAIRLNGLNIDQTLDTWGASETDILTRMSTVSEIAYLYKGLYTGQFIAPEGRAIILRLMSQHTPNDDTRLGVIRPMLPEGFAFYNKRGTITTERLVIGDSAIFSLPASGETKTYLVIIFGYPGEKPTNDVELVQVIEDLARLFWDYINSGR